MSGVDDWIGVFWNGEGEDGGCEGQDYDGPIPVCFGGENVSSCGEVELSCWLF